MIKKMFPLLTEFIYPGMKFQVPLKVAEKAYKEYVRQHGDRQSLREVEQRGGFG